MSPNPKKAFGDLKPGISRIPPSAIIEEGLVMNQGSPYPPFNWNVDPIDATTYYNAIWRHLAAWYTGENCDEKSGLTHLAHIRACAGILIDAQLSGTLVDDRPAGKTYSAGELLREHTKLTESAPILNPL